jgi:hypothetical protein
MIKQYQRMKKSNDKKLHVSELHTHAKTGLSTAHESVFTNNNWLSLFDHKLKRYGVFKKESLQAIFAIQSCNQFGFTRIENPALTPHCGLVFIERNGNTASLSSWRKEIMETIARFIERVPSSLILISFPPWVLDLQPFIWLKYKVITKYTYIVNLTDKTDNNLLSQMSKTRRTQIRNGHKRGLEFGKCTDYKIVEDLVAKTFSRQKKRYQHTLVKKVLQQFADKTNSFAFVTRLNSKPIAACFCVHDRTRAYYLLGGFDHESNVPAAAPIAMFGCIKHARDMGLEHYDFEGSSVPGIERYFRSFGGELTPVFRVIKASLPIEMVLKLFKRHLF